MQGGLFNPGTGSPKIRPLHTRRRRESAVRTFAQTLDLLERNRVELGGTGPLRLAPLVITAQYPSAPRRAEQRGQRMRRNSCGPKRNMSIMLGTPSTATRMPPMTGASKYIAAPTLMT
jgi:hypothetical protein